MSRIPPQASAPICVLSALLFLWTVVPLVQLPFIAVDAGNFREAMSNLAARCPGDPIPAPGGCWSAATARVTITGVDRLGNGDAVDYAVLSVPNQPATRSDLVDGANFVALTVGSTVAVRYWGADIAMIYPPVPEGQAAIALPTRDNPTYRASHFPISDAVVAVAALMGLLVSGRALLDDVTAWRRRRQQDVVAGAAARDATMHPDFQRRMARYGTRDATLRGQGAWPTAKRIREKR